MSIEIIGASDDLIEVNGDIREEFYAEEDGNLLALSNGVVLRILYADSGVWRITPVKRPEAVSITLAPEDDDDNYSDVAVITESVSWVVLGTEIAS